MSRILVTGATGTVGAALWRALGEARAVRRGLARDPAAARERLGGEGELATGDLGDREALRRALDGVDRMFLACGNVPAQVELESNAIDAAREAGVRHVVKLSATGAEVGSPLSFWDWQGQIERHLTASGIPATVLRPTSYMTNLLMSAPAVAAAGRLFAPAGGAGIAMIDPRDVAALAARVLTEDGHAGATYELTGPAAITPDDVADALSEATGRPVGFVDVPDDVARHALTEAAVPPYVVDFLVGLFGAIRAGRLAQVTDAVRRITGREPRTIAEWARDHAAAFRAAAAAPTAAPR